MKFIQYHSQKLDAKKVKRQHKEYALSFYYYQDKHFHEEQFKDHINLLLVTDTNVKIIEKNAFAGCLRLARFDGSAEFVDDSAFSYCGCLTDFNWLPLKYIGKGAFAHSGIKNFYSPESLDIIPENTFEACIQLKKVFLNKIEIIEKNAFTLSGIRVLNLPITLERIGSYAFASCFNLSNIVCESPTPPRITSTTFANDPIQNIWFFSEEQKENYLKNRNWKKYESKMRVTTPRDLKNFLISEQHKWMDE